MYLHNVKLYVFIPGTAWSSAWGGKRFRVRGMVTWDGAANPVASQTDRDTESDKMSVMLHVWYYISANFKCWMDVYDILIRIVRWSFYWWFLDYTFDTWRISGWKVVTWLTWNTRDCMPYFIRVWGASSIPCPILNYSAFSYFRATILGWRLSRYRDWSDWEIYDSSTICREIEVDIEYYSVILENDYRRRSVGWLIFSRWSPSKQPQRRLFKGWTIVICVFVYFIL